MYSMSRGKQGGLAVAQTQISSNQRVAGTKVFRLSISLWTIFMLAGCSESNRCLGRSAPQFDVAVLANPVLNQVYSQVIRASIKNSIEDDHYRYSFTLTGELPQGFSARQDNRLFVLEGTPTVLGVFPLELTVNLDNENNLFSSADVGDLCASSATAAYQLTVSMQ